MKAKARAETQRASNEKGNAMCRLIIFPLCFLDVAICVVASLKGVPSIAFLSIAMGLLHLLLAWIQVKSCFRRER